ncbi:MAG: MetQ/NlpA family ABC transporter substrate-binding protein [Arachnia sp.]
MSTLRKISAALAVSTALLFSGCGADATPATGEDGSTLTTVKVGASPVPHAKILEFVKNELAADAGINLEIVEFDDFVLPNEALASGEIDANYFQHLPYLEDQIKEKGYAFDHGDGIHIEPYAAFSQKYDSFADVPDGATIAITNDAANQIRGLRVLEAEGQLKDVADDSNVLTLTAEQNPRGFKFAENQPEVIVQQLQDPAIDVAFVNGNFILTAGLNTDDAIATEAVENNPNANLLVWRSDNTNDGVKKLDELLHSDKVVAFIKETWPSGDVIAGS